MKAKDIKVGQRIVIDQAGHWRTVSEVRRPRAFKVSLAGYEDRYSVFICFGRGHFENFHPEEDVLMKDEITHV